ncbi:MAG: hypothetical protein IKI50_01510 [Clostridia bacterium]|nr:hypothetical protein [Clostridia bacterium]
MQGDYAFYLSKKILEPCLKVTREYQMLQGMLGQPEEDEQTGLGQRLRNAEKQLQTCREPVYALLRGSDLPAMEYRVVVERYLHGKKWDEIIGELDRTRRHVLRVHSSALHRMAQKLPPKSA